MKIEVEIPISEETLDENAKNRLRYDALEAAVLRLFEERRISSTEAAGDLGLTRIQFVELTRRRGISHHDYTQGNLADDLADLDRLENRLPSPGNAR